MVNVDETDTKDSKTSFAKVFMKVNRHVELIKALVLDIGHDNALLEFD